MRLRKGFIFFFWVSAILTFLPENKSYAQNVIKILPLGNSITVGYTDGTLPVSQQTSYRFALYYQLTQAGYLFDMVGTEQSGCAYFSDCQHAGINGQRDQFMVRLLTDGYDEKRKIQLINPPGPYLDYFDPDIILLHIGTNDVTHETNPGTAQLSAILDLVDAYEQRANKEVTVFLGLIINRMVGYPLRTETSNYNNQLRAMAQTRINNGDRIVIVDQEHDAGFLYNSTDMTDYLHPNSTGYAKMGGLWFSYINSYFNQAPDITPIPDQVVPEGEPFASINLRDYVSDKEDPDQELIWTIIPEDPEHLDILIDANHQASIVSTDENWNGSETIVFKVADLGVNGGFIKFDTDTVVFMVTPVNDAPEFTTTPYLKGKEDSLYYYIVTAKDAENQSITYSASVLPSWLTFDPVTRVLTGRPGNSNTGEQPVTLLASDGTLNTPQSFTIQVVNVNSTPVIVGMTKSIKTVKNTPVDILLTDLLVQDPDNLYPEDFAIYLANGDNYTVSGNSVIPNTDYVGTLRVLARVYDGAAYSPYSNINVQVSLLSGIDNSTSTEALSVYPNPTSDLLYIELPREQDARVELFNSVGLCVFRQDYNNPGSVIQIDTDARNFSSGMYFYQIVTADETYNGKIVVQ